MRVLVSLEHRFKAASDGSIWTHSQFPYSFWRRYLSVFDEVRVLARVKRDEVIGRTDVRCDGDGVQFEPVPYYVGPLQYLRHARTVAAACAAATTRAEAVVLRIPSVISSLTVRSLRRSKRPYGVEVVGDANDVFAPGTVRHPLRVLFRAVYTMRQRRECAEAVAAAYVTEKALQHRYPCRTADALITHFSSIDLCDDAFVPSTSRAFSILGPFKVVTVCSLEHLQKGVDVLLDAVWRCVQSGVDVQLVIVGDGRYRAKLEGRATRLRLGDRVLFAGRVPAGDAVRRYLDDSDLFVLASRQEGLPRAMLEAMARGVPCIGTSVGGVSELLPPEFIVPPADPAALATMIREVLSMDLRQVSTRNVLRAAEYREEALRGRREAFYRHLREATREWLASEKRKSGFALAV